jgi:lauroyl/myristoyl acyltransferase
MKNQRLGNRVVEKLLSLEFNLLETLLRMFREPGGYRFARFVGGILHPPPVRKKMLTTMKLVLNQPDWPRWKWKALFDAHLRWVGHTTIEILYWFKLSTKELRERVSVSGEVHLSEALKAGRGAVLFANHLGNYLSFIIQAASWAREACSFGNVMPIPMLEREMEALCGRFNVPRWLVGQGNRFHAIETLERNGLVITFIDVTTVKKNNVWIRYGNAERLINMGPALLALENDAEILCLSFQPLRHGQHHRITIHPPLPRPVKGDLHENALQISQKAIDLVTKDLFRRPQQLWYWEHNKFRKSL